MTKTLKDFFEVYRPKSPDEQKFVDKHVVIKHKDRNGNGDDVFQAKNIKKIDRKKERHGYEPGDDEQVYEEVEVSEESDPFIGKYAYQHRRGHYVKANVLPHPKGGYLLKWADGSSSHIKDVSAMKTTIKVNNMMAEETLEEGQGSFSRLSPMGNKKSKDNWKGNSKKPRKDYDRDKRTVKDRDDMNEEVLNEVVKYHQYEISHTQVSAVGNEGPVTHITGNAAKMRKHAISAPTDGGHYGRTIRLKVKNTETGAHSYHNAYMSDHNEKTGKSTVSVRPIVGSSVGKQVSHNKVLASYLAGKRKISEDVNVLTDAELEALEEMRGRSYASVKPGYYHRGPTSNKPLDDDLRKGLDAIDAAFKKAREPKKPVAEDVEPIEELSKATLKSYVKKAIEPKNAMKAVEKKHDDARKDAKAMTRLQGYGQPAGEDGGVNAAHARYSAAADRTKHAAGMRKKYVHKALDKMAEGVEQIDEVGDTKRGRAALAKYIVNRTDDMVSNAYNTGRGKLDNGKDFNKTMEREVKHKEGIMNAAVRLAKPRKFRRYYGEELAGSFVDKYMPEQVVLTSEERLVNALLDQNISEMASGHVLALFNTLDENNQRVLVDTIIEGRVDEVLDFAIQNRD